MKMKMEMENRSYRYDMNGPKARHGHKCSKHQKCLGMMLSVCIPICIKQHLRYNWRGVEEKNILVWEIF